MTRVALIVEYEIHTGQEEAFTAILKDHAEKCLKEEPGCLRFEVLQPLDEQGKPVSNRLMANELFESHEALLAHRATPRFEKISEQFKILLSGRRPVLCLSES